MANSDTIHFSNSPLNEVVLGISFSGVKWEIEHYGLFFKSHEPPLSSTKIQHPLAAPGAANPSLAFITQPELPRVWFEFKEREFLIQIQGDRFFLNWRKVEGENNIYPHFSEVYKRFEIEWDQFVSFCEKNLLGSPKVEQLELTYVNHLLKGSHWSSLSELTDSFKSLEFTKNYSDIGALVFDLKYKVDDVSVIQSYKPAKTQTGEDLYVIEFKTRAKVTSSGEAKKLMRTANGVLAKEFVNATSPTAHKKWGYTNV